MRGHAVLGLSVHVFGAYLNFNTLTFWPNNRGVQALVAVGFGHGNIVFKAPVHWSPLRMHKPKCRVAVLDILDQHAKGHDVVHFVQTHGLGLHLFIDAVLVLDAPVNLPFNAV